MLVYFGGIFREGVFGQIQHDVCGPNVRRHARIGFLHDAFVHGLIRQVRFQKLAVVGVVFGQKGRQRVAPKSLCLRHFALKRDVQTQVFLGGFGVNLIANVLVLPVDVQEFIDRNGFLADGKKGLGRKLTYKGQKYQGKKRLLHERYETNLNV